MYERWEYGVEAYGKKQTTLKEKRVVGEMSRTKERGKEDWKIR
jgi:hypothetical protein